MTSRRMVVLYAIVALLIVASLVLSLVITVISR